MELHKLNSRAMLALSEYWLQEPFMRAQFRAHDLGVAVRTRLREVYGDLTELYAPHLVYGIRSLELVADDKKHSLEELGDRVYLDLEARIASAPSERWARRIKSLKHVLFPNGPGSLCTSPPPKDSRRLSRDEDISPDNNWFTRLRSVEVSESKLIDAYGAWAVIEDRRSYRARKYGLHDVSGRTISAAAKVRQKWLGVTRALYTAIPLMPWPEDIRMQVFRQLEESVATIVERVAASDADALSEPDPISEMLSDAGGFNEDILGEDTLEIDPDAFEVVEEPPNAPVPAS